MYGAVEEPLLFGNSKGYNSDYGAWLEPKGRQYYRIENEKSYGFTSQGDGCRIYRFHKKTGVGVVVTKDDDGHISVNFIG